MKYRLSKLIPMHMQSTYERSHNDGPFVPEHASWWQWRDRIFAHRITPLA